MESLKSYIEVVGVLRDKLQPVAEWASVSEWRKLFLVSVTFVAVFGIVYLSADALMDIAIDEAQDRGEQMRLLTDELQYKAALDSIDQCINATKDKLTLRGWYCKHATMMFEQASKRWPQDRPADILTKHAYGAMKTEVAHYLRSIELRRLGQTPPTREQKLLKFLASKVGSGLIMALLFSVVFGGMYYVRKRPSKVAASETGVIA